MKKQLLKYLQHHHTSMQSLLDASFLLENIEVKQIVYMINERVNDEELQFIKKQLEQDCYVGLYTNLNLNNRIKESFRNIAVIEDDEKTIHDKRFFFSLNKFLWFLLSLATVVLIVSVGLNWGGFPMDQYNDTYRLFIPLVIIYGLFVGIDLIRSFLVKHQTINTYLQLNLFKSRKYDLKVSWFFVDQKQLFIRLDKSYYDLNLGWYQVVDEAAIKEFGQILESFTPLPKSVGLTENQVLVWLYEE